MGLGFGSGSSINSTFMILILTVTRKPSLVLAAQIQNSGFYIFGRVLMSKIECPSC